MTSMLKEVWEELNGKAAKRRWEAEVSAMKERAAVNAYMFCRMYPPPKKNTNSHPYSDMGRGT